MKKIFLGIVSLIIFIIIILTGKNYAATLNNIEVNTDKTTIRPGQNVTVSINFGESLGAYTFDILYDNAIFEYVSVDGGTANDTSDKVRVVFYDETGGTSPRNNMSVTFKAKDELTTSNPTQFLISAEGLGNSDATSSFDDITTPITKDVLVEPEYIDYVINLEPTSNLIKDKENKMKISYSSSMGRYYEHARLVAEATTPEGATVEITGVDTNNTEYDFIENGWGAVEGYEIGGKDYALVLNVIGVFSEIGDYEIKLKLIDKDNTDSIIAQNTFNLTVIEETTIQPEQNEVKENITTTENKTTIENSNTTQNTTNTQTPTKLPKTGIYSCWNIANFYISNICLPYKKKIIFKSK